MKKFIVIFVCITVTFIVCNGLDAEEEVNKVFKQIDETVQATIKDMENQANEKVDEAIGEVKNSVNEKLNEIKKEADEVVEEVKNVVNENIKNVTNEIESQAKEAVEKVFEELKQKGVKYIKDFIKKHLGTFKKVIFDEHLRTLLWDIYVDTHNMCPGVDTFTNVVKHVSDFCGIEVKDFYDLIHQKKNIKEILDFVTSHSTVKDNATEIIDGMKEKTMGMIKELPQKSA